MTLLGSFAPLIGYAQGSRAQPGTIDSSTPYSPATTPSGSGTTQIIYTPLEPLTTTLGGFETGKPGDFSNLVNGVYKLLIGLGAILAVVTIVIYGILYMTSEVANTKAMAKTRLLGVVYGLLILLGAWIILNTINPQLVKVGLFLPTVTSTASTGTTASTASVPSIANSTCGNNYDYFYICPNHDGTVSQQSQGLSEKICNAKPSQGGLGGYTSSAHISCAEDNKATVPIIGGIKIFGTPILTGKNYTINGALSPGYNSCINIFTTDGGSEECLYNQ